MNDNSQIDRPKRIRRTPEVSRAAAIQAAHKLLIEHGPAAVTLQAVARAANMTHGNLSHHFGTSAALQAAMILEMAGQLTQRASLLVSGMRAGSVPAAMIVDLVFDGFAAGGYGRLIASLTASGGTSQLAPFFDALKASVEALRAGEPGDVNQETHGAGPIVMGLLGHAFAASLFGRELEVAAGMPAGSLRKLATRQLESLRAIPHSTNGAD
jgi:AcrR family transcriptional regulator